MNANRPLKVLGWACLSALLFSACAKPKVVPQNGKQYVVVDRQEELFVYVEYRWRGGKFSDAVALEEAFVQWADDKGILVYAMGRFPTSKLWQLGFVAKEKPDATEFQGRKISTLTLPAGQWASLHTVDNTDHLFLYWKKFAKWLEDDGHIVGKPVFEVYPDVLKVGIDDESSRGEIRYPVGPEASE